MMTRWIPLLLVAAALLGGCGLIAGTYAVAGVAYGVESIDNNGAFRDYEATLQGTWDACLAELKKREIEIPEDAKLEEGGGRIDKGDGHLKVFPHPKYKQYTRVYVRIGTFDTSEKWEKTKAFLDDLSKLLDDD